MLVMCLLLLISTLLHITQNNIDDIFWCGFCFCVNQPNAPFKVLAMTFVVNAKLTTAVATYMRYINLIISENWFLFLAKTKINIIETNFEHI